MTINALEWLNENAHRNYPLADGANTVSNGGVRLPESFLLDMDIMVRHAPATVDASSFFLHSVAVSSGSARFYIGYTDGTNTFACAASSGIPLDTVPSDTPVEAAIAPVEDSTSIPDTYKEMVAGISGTALIGSCRSLPSIGLMTFTAASAPLNSLRIHLIQDTGIDSVTVMDANGGTLGTITEDFIIRAGDGISLSIDSGAKPVLTITRIDTASNGSSITSVEDAVTAIINEMGNPVRVINGVSPDSNGAFTFTGGACVDVATSGKGLKLSNPCSMPCCGTQSVSELQSVINQMEEARNRLETYYTALSTNVNNMQARLSSLIASRTT